MNISVTLWVTGGDDGIRTHDPLLAGQVLSQLSYTPRKILRYCFSPFSIRSWRALDSQATFVPCLSLAVTSFLPFPLLAPSPSLSLPFLTRCSLEESTRLSSDSYFRRVFDSVVGPSGLEPPTSCLSGTRSNLLSYEPMWLVSDPSLGSF